MRRAPRPPRRPAIAAAGRRRCATIRFPPAIRPGETPAAPARRPRSATAPRSNSGWTLYGACGASPGRQCVAPLPAARCRRASSNAGATRRAVGADQLLKDRAIATPRGSECRRRPIRLGDLAQCRSCPERMHSCNPISTGRQAALRPGICRRKAMTWPIQSTNPMPRRPSGAGTSLRSRCVWALTRPGRMATLPRSSTGPARGPRRRRPRSASLNADRAVGQRRTAHREDVTGTEGASFQGSKRFGYSGHD